MREIQALRRLSPHQHIITLEEVLYDQPTGRLALVFELMDANLYELIRGRRHYLNANLVRSYMFQLVRSLHHMHRKGIFHRDIKPENILIENTSEMGRGLKLADFGSCRGIYSKQPYTEYISTRWYRAPECLLTDGYYGPEMDLWGAGCVFFEITSLYPLFPGTNELDQINRIHKVLGTPGPELLAKFKRNGAAHVNFDFPEQKGIGLAQLIPHASPECVDLTVKMLAYDAADRMSAREGLQHPYFRDIRELEARRQQEAGQAASSTVSGAAGTSGGAGSDGCSEKDPSPAKGDKGGPPRAVDKALPNISGGSYGDQASAHSTGGQAKQPSYAHKQSPSKGSGDEAETLPPIGSTKAGLAHGKSPTQHQMQGSKQATGGKKKKKAKDGSKGSAYGTGGGYGGGGYAYGSGGGGYSVGSGQGGYGGDGGSSSHFGGMQGLAKGQGSRRR